MTCSEIYHAGEDGALYLVHEQSSSDQILQRFENLRSRHESALKRQVREYLEQEEKEEKQLTNNTEQAVWFSPKAK